MKKGPQAPTQRVRDLRSEIDGIPFYILFHLLFFWFCLFFLFFEVAGDIRGFFQNKN
jgi:hypothetical protein